ncbi:hypothetical protein B0H16DRAFT_1814924 [Mycena metata]|uniref:FAD/NAD(P)-binding domain-containing protein n=1 Tax=Mycena metata TaxID=1033252 RepID=A0AAD7H4C9_9AGAR|nr:hypothetical protein B0H16DRAFT_1814924 [Mycena metata]
MSKPKSPANVVVLGGGGAGARIARTLAQQLGGAKVTLIEAREYYLMGPFACLLEDKVPISYDRLFANTTGTVVHGTATSIVRNTDQRSGHVSLDSGDVWEGPLAFPRAKAAALEHISEWRENIKNAQGVAIVGGGPVGAEIAGEIRDIYPDKKMALVERENHLFVSRYPDKYRIDADKRWKERNISLIFEDEIEEVPPFPASGATPWFDFLVIVMSHIPTRGGRPNTAVVSTLGPGLLSEEGYIKADPHLQVKGLPGIFVGGDVLDWQEVKQVAKVPGHISVVVANVKSFIRNKRQTAIYNGTFELIVVTNGANGGVAFIDKLWGCISATLLRR